MNAYHEWLGIPAKYQPPTHYRLLGIERDERDPRVIENAADQRMMLVRSYQSSHPKESQRLLNELAQAKGVLLNVQRRADYDATLPRSKPAPRAVPKVRNSSESAPKLPPRIVVTPRRRKSRPWLVPVYMVVVAGVITAVVMAWPDSPAPVSPSLTKTPPSPPKPQENPQQDPQVRPTEAVTPALWSEPPVRAPDPAEPVIRVVYLLSDPVRAPEYVEPKPPRPVDRFAGKEAGDEWSKNPLKMVFCWCPGSEEIDGFWMGKAEVTQGQWYAATKTRPWTRNSLLLNNQAREGPAYPAQYMTYLEAAAFVALLNKADRRLPKKWEYALPTAVQWEHAYKAGGYGEENLLECGWFSDNTRRGERWPRPVGQKKPNAWGLHDMLGNVAEWFRPALPIDLRAVEARVGCGGGSVVHRADSAERFRMRVEPNYRGLAIGLRLAIVRQADDP